jgi:hypothetical protein
MSKRRKLCGLDLFRGIDTKLAIVLQVRIQVQKYLYVDNDEVGQYVSLQVVYLAQ